MRERAGGESRPERERDMEKVQLGEVAQTPRLMTLSQEESER